MKIEKLIKKAKGKQAIKPCPHCGAFLLLTWRNSKKDKKGKK